MEQKGNILIVDDDENVRLVLSRQLEASGFHCETAGDGQEGLEKLREGDFEISLVDLKMPRKDGLQLVREARIDRIRTVFIILSGYGEVKNVVEAMKFGAFDFLEKPATPDEIQVSVERAARHAYTLRHAQEMASVAKQWESVFDSSPDMVLILDGERRVLRCNQAVADRVGKPKDELVGRYCYEILTGLDCLPEFRKEFDGSIRQGTTITTKIYHEEWDAYFLSARVPLRDDNGKTWGAFYSFRDITASIRAEEEIRDAHAEMERVLSSISSILIGVGPDGTVIRWNSSAERTFGIPAEKILHQPFSHCGIRWNWDQVLPQIENAIRNRESNRLDDIRYTRPDGKEGLLGITINPFLGPPDKDHGFLLLGSDITDRKMLEAQLAQAQKLEAIGQLAAGIAHEINTPTQYVSDNTRFLKDCFTDLLEVIKKLRGFLESAKSGTVPEERIEEVEESIADADLNYLLEEIPQAIDQSLEGLDRVAKIVRAMKEFSHPGSEEKTSIDLNKALESTITVSRNEWKYVADVVTDFDRSLPPVPCLPGDFNQVMLNLIVNAAHAIADVVERGCAEKGTIRISTRRDGDWVEIRVSDSGAGIPGTIRHRIFDPFFTTKEVGKGTGQGLAIARSVIVDKHNGTIDFESEEGKGTTFVVRLPLEHQSPNRTKQREQTHGPSPLSNR